MLTLEAKRMGYRVVTLEPLPNSPCGQVADEQIVAAYDDARAIGELGARSDVVTYEFENIPLESIRLLQSQSRNVRPSGDVLRVTQDRILEKTFVRDAGCATAAFEAVTSADEMQNAVASLSFPAVMKTSRGGYDGKGQWVVRDAGDAEVALGEARGAPCIYERFVPFEREVSIICARGSDGKSIAFPITENVHDHGVLDTTIVPARLDSALAERVRANAALLGERLQIVGAYCVEFFILGDDVLVNEIAPRVHNSGHYSLDATQISQYEAHVRAICDLPLVQPRLLAPAVMMNILGTGEGDVLEGSAELLREPELKLHLYGKRHAALRRKMGHFTVLGSSVAEALAKASEGRSLLSWRPSTAVAGRPMMQIGASQPSPSA
ncbi:MAG: 5-(carboxyamino)imidazole ribonucleotide synthase [Candidatus Eremiobacteraeota bacterium]|nr:5-(carboxyamino)imidazole ribonucleotide synthase [Candidatus Eremiobacteraeota bacterium]